MQSATMNRLLVIGGVLLIIASIVYVYIQKSKSTSVLASFAECAAAGFPVTESYPRQCRTPAGRTFKEDIGNELEKDALIRISTPRPNTTIRNPLVVKGMARGSWFFEAQFPVKLFDGNGELLASTPASAKGEWMTSDFVPFEATLTFTAPTTTTGTLVLLKDNPSGLPENEDELRIPIAFK